MEFAHLMRKELGNNKIIIIIISAPGEDRLVSLALCRVCYLGPYKMQYQKQPSLSIDCLVDSRGGASVAQNSEQNDCENRA